MGHSESVHREKEAFTGKEIVLIHPQFVFRPNQGRLYIVESILKGVTNVGEYFLRFAREEEEAT